MSYLANLQGSAQTSLFSLLLRVIFGYSLKLMDPLLMELAVPNE